MMPFYRVLFLVLTVFTCFAGKQMLAQVRSYECSALKGTTPEIDGLLDDEAWKSSNWTAGFIQRDPYDGKNPSQLTSFSIVYDNNNLYIAIKASDSMPSGIVKRLSRRDVYDGDWVAIEIDSYDDNLTAFAFGVTASGVKFDVMLINDMGSDDTWDPIWYVKTTTHSEGWNAEMKIPLSQLRFARKENHSWGLQVLRYIYRNQEYSNWQPIPRDATGWVSKFGDLTGIQGIVPHRDVEILPYTMAKAIYDQKEEGNPFAKGHEYKATAGVDGKISVTNDLTLNFTINPDFGQVEADPSVVNLTAFESYFPEKRPFFIEGKNIFDYKLTGADDPRNQLFYSRRIGSAPHSYPALAEGEYAKVPEETSILGSFKLSGKTHKGLSIGILESITQNEKAVIDLDGTRRKESVEPLTSFFVSRLKQDYKKGDIQLGGIFTATNRFTEEAQFSFLPGSAYAGGFDFIRYWKNKTYYLSLKGVLSSVQGDTSAITYLQTSSSHYFQRPDLIAVKVDSNSKALQGHGGTVEIGKTGRGHWQYKAWLTWRSPGLDFNNLGYMRQADEIQQLAWIGYRYYKPFSIFRYIAANFNQWYGWDFDGLTIYKGINLSTYTKFTNYWSAQISANFDSENLARYELRGGPALKVPGGIQLFALLQTDDRKKISFKLSNTRYWGGEHSYRSSIYSAGITFKPVNSFSFSFEPDYTLSDNVIQYVTTKKFDENQSRYIIAHLKQNIFRFSMRINFNLTPDLSFQYYGQPFLYAGKYDKFKYVTDPKAGLLTNRYKEYEANQLSTQTYEGRNYFLVDENKDQTADYWFWSPDLNFLELRSNLVIRWEYIPGSTLYLVWSQGRTGIGSDSNFNLPGYMNNLFEVFPENVILLKFSYMIIR